MEVVRVSTVITCTIEKLKQRGSSLAGNKKEAVPIAPFLALIVIDVVDQLPQAYDYQACGS
jgi:hypothetical protein